MNFKFDGKKVKADMTKQLGYAQAGATKFIDKAGAAASTAKSMGAKATGQAAAGGAINAFGKGMKLAAKANPATKAALAVGVVLGGAIQQSILSPLGLKKKDKK